MNWHIDNYTAWIIGAVMIVVLAFLVRGIINEKAKIRQIRIKKEKRIINEKVKFRENLIKKEESIRKYQLEIVKANSRRYQELLSLSMRYCFDRDIKLQYTLFKTVSNKAQYDHFDSKEYLCEKIEQRFDECERFIQRVYANLTLYECYCIEIKKLPPEATYLEAAQKDIPYAVYWELEQGLCQPLFEEEFMAPTILIHVQYQSPQGRNAYRCDYVVVFEEFARLFETVRKRRDARNTAVYQRKIMSTSLRYDIMKRDGFRCVLCGRSADDQVKLHVDHILPVSKGGKTEYSNLRTLCSECNLGKRDKYDEQGTN